MKGAVPGTPVGAEEKNWVVGKYGRVLPIVNIRRRDKGKIMKVDPSKFCHNSKRMKEDNMEVSDVGIQNLTWSIDTKDSEMIKRRKGEFPTWKQKEKKQYSDVDMKSLADYYESFTKSGSQSEKTDFEVVPENFLKASQKRTYFSEDNDSSDNGVDNFKTSTPFPSPFPQSQQKTTVATGKDHSEKSEVVNTGKTAILENTNCTPIMKQVGKGSGNRDDKALPNSKSSSPLKTTLTQEIKPTSVLSTIPSTNSSQNTVPTEHVPTSNSKKSKTQSKRDELLNQSNSISDSKEEFSSDSFSKFSNKNTERSDVKNGNKIASQKPKLQAFGGTRHLYDNPSSDCQQKVDSSSPSKSTSSMCQQKADSPSLANTISSAASSLPTQPHSEALIGVKRTLFQNSMLKTPTEKEKEIQQDSDGESVSSADTDVIISSAKKQRGGGTVMGYGSLETPVSLQTSFNNSISEFGGGLVDGEASWQASWMEQHAYDLDDSEDSNDFEKLAQKILKNHKVTNNFASGKDLRNQDGEIKKKIVQSPEREDSEESDSEDSSDDDNNNDTTSDSDKDNESGSSIEDMQCDDKDDGSGNSDDKEDSDEEDSGKDIGKKKSVEKESSDESSGDESNDEDSGEESDDEESTSSEEETTEVSKEVNVMKDVSKEAGKNTKKDKIEHQEQTEKSSVDIKENKGKRKGKVDQERLSKEANRKKQEALRLKQEEYNNRKSIIKQALSIVDNTKRPNRIVFNSDSDDDAAQNSTANTSASQQPDKKAWDLQESDDEDESEDDSSEEEEESAEEEEEKIKSGVKMGTVTADKKEKKSLFDDDSSDGGDDDEDAFENKPQFEGEAGSQLMRLQMKFSSDSRFKLDQRFAESDEEKDDGEGDVEVEDEKIRNLKVLQEVVGVPVTVVTDKKDRQKKLFKDISTLQYDPSREDHKNFEIQPTPDQKKDGKKKKSKKQKADDDENMEDAAPLPVVSSEKFYEVTSALEDAFKKPDDNNSKTGTGAFSLLAAFGSKTDDSDEEEEMQEETTVLTPKWQGFNLQNSSDDDDLSSDGDEERETEGGQDSKKEEEKPVFVAKSKDSFFFTEDDERIKEGIASFCRQEDLEKIREHWQERRPDLIKAYHAKYKRAVRNKRALEKTKTPTRRK